MSLSQQQTGRLRRLIERVRAFSAGCCWGGRPLGSVILWEKHKAALERILQIASSITITQVMMKVHNWHRIITRSFDMRFTKKNWSLIANKLAITAGWRTATSMVGFTARMSSRSPPPLKRSTGYRSFVGSLRASRYFGTGTENLAWTRSISFHTAADRHY